MGVDIKTIGRHGLDTRDVRALAEDISRRMHVNIIYGYVDSYQVNNGKVVDGSGKWVELGRCKDHEGGFPYSLSDRAYTKKKVLDVLGERRDKMINAFWEEHYLTDYTLERDIECEEGIVDYMDICKELCSISISTEPFRWPIFHANFEKTGQFVHDADVQTLNEYRHDLKHCYEQLGCRSIYYYNDQGTSFLLEQIFFTRKEFLEKIKELGLRTINIPNFLRSKARRYSKNVDDVFYDDFKDLIAGNAL